MSHSNHSGSSLEILVLHRVPYPRIEYHRGIDHHLHNVTYLGTQAAIDTVPPGLRCQRVVRAGLQSAHHEAMRWLAQAPRRFDRVISMSEYELLDAARIREALAIEGASLRAVTLTRNKLKMKEAVAARGLRAPRFMSLEHYLQQQGQVPWQGSTVLKPHSGASSVDVSIHPDGNQAFTAISERVKAAGLAVEDFQVEEFIDGPIRHFDGLIQNGRLLSLTSSQYVGTCLAYMDAGQPLGSWHLHTTAKLRQWVSDALAAVEINDGAFHLEAIMAGEDPVFLEVGNRVGGAGVVATYELATGIHLPSQELRVHVDGPRSVAALPAQPTTLGYGWFVFPGHGHSERVYQGLAGGQALRDHPFVQQWDELALGAPLPSHITYSAHEAPLAGILKAPDPDQAHAWMRHAFSQLRLATRLGSVA